VIYATLSMEGDGAPRAAVEEEVRRAGGTATWRSNAAVQRSYALLELPNAAAAAAIAAVSNGTVYENPVIALALFPRTPEALPPLLEALGGAGRPAGILACGARGDALVVEWDPAVTSARLIVELIDLELARFHSGCAAELLSPLPPSLAASIAADGLQAPQIGPKRVLELRVNDA
jgi:hypothetical protein